MIGPSTVARRYATRPLGEVAQFLDHLRKPVTAANREPGQNPYYGANGQQDSVAGWIFDEPLVLLAEDGGHFETPERGIAYQVEGKTWVNNHAHVLRADLDFVSTRWLARVLEHYDVSQFLTGSTRAKLTKSGASRIPIPLPPIEEQRRIAAVLDAADALRAKRRQALAKLDTLTQAVFIEMFGDPVGGSAQSRPLAEVAKVVTGNTPPRSDSANFGPGIEWIKSDNIHESGFVESAAEQLSQTGEARARVAPIGSTLVVCIAGSPASIGRAGLLDRSAAFNQQINAVIPGPELLPEFAFSLLRVGKRLVQTASTNSMKGMVSKSALQAIEVMVPPLTAQVRFAERIGSVAAVRELLAQSSDELDTLFASLQQRAFRGEL